MVMIYRVEGLVEGLEIINKPSTLEGFAGVCWLYLTAPQWPPFIIVIFVACMAPIYSKDSKETQKQRIKKVRRNQ